MFHSKVKKVEFTDDSVFTPLWKKNSVWKILVWYGDLRIEKKIDKAVKILLKMNWVWYKLIIDGIIERCKLYIPLKLIETYLDSKTYFVARLNHHLVHLILVLIAIIPNPFWLATCVECEFVRLLDIGFLKWLEREI